FVYTNLAEEFPGYSYALNPETKKMESTYMGENPSEGGYVFARPGIWHNVAVLDIASMHPSTIEQLNLFGEYTQRYADLKKARVAIKRRDYKTASTVLDGRLKPFLNEADFDPEVETSDSLTALSYALKIVINIVY